MAAETRGARLSKREAKAKRLRVLPAYLFEELVRIKHANEARGADVIDLSIGDPDLGAPDAVVEALREHASDPRLHTYTPQWVIEKFCEAAAAWMKMRFGVELDPASQVLPVVGTKEGLAHLPLAVLDPGDRALVPDPAYPVYARGVAFAGAREERMPLEAERGFLPDMAALGKTTARLAFVNYPNNPTSAVAGLDFYTELVGWARGAGAYVASDAAYSEVVFDGYVSPSILQVPGAAEVAIELHSFSKTFNMAGWRVGFAAGSAELVGALRTLKSNLDSGVFGPILLASVAALECGSACSKTTLKEYALRRSLLAGGLRDAGIDYHISPATLYIWAKVPGAMGSLEFAKQLLERSGVLVAPGVGFGPGGEGYFRMSITCPTPRVREAAGKLRETARIQSK
jgi:LL-diaminopimelate aminotransferase